MTGVRELPGDTSFQPRSRGLPRSGVGPPFTAGGADGVPGFSPRSRGFAEVRLQPRRATWAQAKPREAPGMGLPTIAAHGQPAVNGGPTPLRGKPRERG